MYVVKELKELFPQHKPQLFYDISCTLYSHMKVVVSLDQCMHDYYVSINYCQQKDNIGELSQVTVALSVFHAYGHKADCQVRN